MIKTKKEIADLKHTRAREIILQKILTAKAGQHFSADELWESLQKKDQNVSKATVYRTLNILLEKKVVEEHDFGKGQKYYERMVERPHHDHLIGVRCGCIIEFENPQIELLQEEVAKKEDFVITYHSHKIFGTCSQCHYKERGSLQSR